MIDIKTYKEILIKNGITDLQEEEIIKLRDQQDEMAEVFFNMWVNKIRSKKTEV